jgi:hypothetical protein
MNSMMLHVRGGGDPIATIAQFAKPQGWSALDCSKMEFLSLENPSQECWQRFQAYRDKILKQTAPSLQTDMPRCRPWWKFW